MDNNTMNILSNLANESKMHIREKITAYRATAKIILFLLVTGWLVSAFIFLTTLGIPKIQAVTIELTDATIILIAISLMLLWVWLDYRFKNAKLKKIYDPNNNKQL